MSFTKAYAYYGIVRRNLRWSWSACSADDLTVVVTMWRDQLKGGLYDASYYVFSDPTLAVWQDKPGNRERIENIQHAIDNCDGRFRVVLIVAKDTTVRDRKITYAGAWAKLVMRITDFDAETGRFKAVSAVEA